MIIDTESPEGRALVALEKFGREVLDGRDPQSAAFDHSLLSYEYLEGRIVGVSETDLAKLPEGL